ncbi:hypothetical protein A7X12_08635 [Sphingomonas sp. TDK1]|nr:hypothetical protein A7X12_08635 [Sphingomonas sp. TDK1]
MGSLGADRGGWARAMAAECDAAEADGRLLGFALGCLLGAWRILPQHREGRFTLLRHAFSLGMLLPMAALLAVAAILGLPWIEAPNGVAWLLVGNSGSGSLLNAGSRSVAPALTLVLLQLSACHLPLAWWMLDRDWNRVAAAARFGAAAMVTLLIVTACAALNVTALLLPCTMIGVEFAAVLALASMQSRQDRHAADRNCSKSV